MTPEKRFARLVLVLVVLLVVGGGWSAGKRPEKQVDAFTEALDLQPLETLAVYADGRVKSFSSFANEVVGNISGPRGYAGQSPVHTYLELMWRPSLYAERDCVYVKNKLLRADLRDALARAGAASDPAWQATFLETGMVAPALLSHPEAQAVLDRRAADLVRTARFVNQVEYALGSMQPMGLKARLTIIPPPPEGSEQWATFQDLTRPSAIKDGFTDAAGRRFEPHPPELVASLSADISALQRAWVSQDAAAVNAAASSLAADLRAAHPEAYPAAKRLELEAFYFASYNLTWIWMIYLLAVIPLLLALVYRWKGAWATSLVLFLVAFGFHTWALGLRWYISGRWPNSNMFEAVTTSAWFGGLGALVLLIWVRGVVREAVLLTSAVSSMLAFMAAYYFPADLNPNISNMMPVLNDLWLYIHTNVIIWSYVIIFMAAVSALLYLGWRLCGGAPSYVRLGGAAMLAGDKPEGGRARGQTQVALSTAAGPVAIESVEVETGLDANAAQGVAAERTDLGTVLDGVTMVMMELSFVMLWAGIVMGAIWADHSWGRPWGWDPKEVFALNTFLVFAVLVHARIKARDKGLWTAWLALIGAVVMLFNWIVINLKISGLHSYA